jgi:RNA-directed DNA polymerase
MNVGEMQRKLSQWAEQDTGRKFYELYKLLSHPDWLQLAHDYVSRNAGSKTAGCDGLNMKLFDENLEINLQRIAQELKLETFEPSPTRRVHIPKPNGKVRPLGILSIRDRIVQEALRMILEPIYEADFSRYSFGFRPNRCTMDAIKWITWNTQESKKFFWIVEGDLAPYFDTICHRELVKLLHRRMEDEKLIRLLWKFLRAGVMEGSLFKDTKLGVSQGGIVSPLLANIYLTELDRYMECYTELSTLEKRRRRKQGLANVAYARFADDFVVLVNGTKEQVEEFKEELQDFLKKHLRLTLSKEKTKITHLNDGFEFLGFHIRRSQGHNGMKTKVLIPEQAVDKVCAKIAEITDAKTDQDSVNAKILALNGVIGGWCRYYQYTSKAATQFGKVERYTFWRMAHWLGRKFKIRMPAVMERYKSESTFATAEYRLLRASEFSTLTYKKRFFKPNPYTTQEPILREALPQEGYWVGNETRKGMADLRPLILERDGYICQRCDRPVTAHKAQIDHIRPVRRFKRPIDANHPDNLWTLCDKCHTEKTKADRQMESPLPGELARRVRREE